MPYLVTAPNSSLPVAPSVLGDLQGASDPSDYCHPATTEPILSEHDLESTGQLQAKIILDSNVSDPSDLLRVDLACPAMVDPAYGRADQRLFSSQEPARTGHLNGHTSCANWDIDMYPSWTYCHSDAAMKQFLAELDAKIRQDTLFC
ncbi:hypothetical protein PENANT_c108G05596 [Penicillium antarcticum]|uniref:Uncharacterized protein n=1 Tax=Penicillium antarcticum TaxID=416450 RepID=A0A1V6PK69_9EURO|nr:hypothetical protein PENANT_c108G05596 [Penicillium antarcticum]